MNKEGLEKELCEIVELVAMLEHICANTSESSLPSAGMQLTLIQARKKLQALISALSAKSMPVVVDNSGVADAIKKPVFNAVQHGIPLSERIRKVPINKERAARVRELLVAQEDQGKEVINW